MKTLAPSIALLGVFAAGICGCATITADSPIVREKLQIVSAGYTGCMPEENVLSNLAPKPDGSGTWNATCRGKTYLCSVVSAVNSESFHCAPVAQ